MSKIIYDVQGELSILGSCLLFSDCLAEAVQRLESVYFYDPLHREVFGLMKNIYNRGESLNLESLNSEAVVRGVDQSIRRVMQDLKRAASKQSFSTFMNNTIENHFKTQLAEMAKSVLKNLSSESFDQISNIILTCQNNFNIVKTHTPKSIIQGEFYGEKSIFDWIESNRKRFEEGIEVSGIPTGFQRLDKAINGMNRGHFITLGGAPGSGKTTFCLQIMLNAIKSGRKCGIISLEMSKEQLIVKLASLDSGISYNDIFSGNLHVFNSEKVMDSIKKMQSSDNLIIQDSSINSLSALRARVRNLVEVHGVEFLIIDYLTLIKNDVGGNLTEKIQGISDCIRNLAKDLDIPCLVICQLNRKAEDEGSAPKKHHILGSGQIERDSHEILLLHKLTESNQRSLYVAKSRFSVETKIYYDLDSYGFKECDNQYSTPKEMECLLNMPED